MSGPPRPAAVTLGTRASALARTQTELVVGLLQAAWPDLECATRVIDTAGDRTQVTGEPLPEIGGKGLFTEELERALRERAIDLAVHSLKDLPTVDADGVVVGAVLAREDAGDCLVARSASSLSDLADGATVGTSSLRRAAQLRAARPDLDVRSIRGNVDTRVRKVTDGEYDATVLAAAGLRRLGLEHVVTEWLSPELMLPAPGQGALAIQCRADDPALELVRAIDDAPTRAETTAERSFLRVLGAGCAAPVAARATVTTPPRVRLQGLVSSVDGRDVVRVQGEGEPREIGEQLARDARRLGADRILAAIRG
ncbi:MAG TPA: hydroxymethylbilane synthase [Gaiellaceae bacterium]|nr:hydroxymethylbilane synthase [Gaiellaceae bacterium]